MSAMSPKTASIIDKVGDNISGFEESKVSKSIKDGSEKEDGDDDEEEEEEEDEDMSSCIFKQEDLIFNPSSGLRNWLKSRGKEHYIDFEDEELR